MSSFLDPHSPLPRYYQIYSALLTQIKSGELSVGEALPPERVIAERYKVARLTVVKALDLLEHDGLIHKQQGRGSFILPPLKTPSKTIAYIKVGWQVYHELEGISHMALMKDYQLQTLAVDIEFGKLGAYLETCIQNGVEGLIVYARAGYEDLKLYQNLITMGIPMVMVDRYYPAIDTDHVVYNDEKTAAKLTEKLIQRGHQRIAIIPGFELETTTVQHRLEGYRNALKKHNLPYDEDLIWLELYNTYGRAEKRSSVRQRTLLFEKLTQTRPTAIVTINDGIYENLSHDLRHLEPRLAFLDQADFALEVATFSYRQLPESNYLKLLALQPGAALGQIAARLLIERLEGAQKTSIRAASQRVSVPMDILELGPDKLFRHKQSQWKEVAQVSSRLS
jgi:GntR family transcriptional regulator, arabinose operon transcriptional repressor